MSTRIGVDIGGTFTDIVIYDSSTGRVDIGKVPTTPASPELGSVEAVRLAASGELLARADYFLHGTTVGLNALLERRGAKVGLLCTDGFRDTIEIGRGGRPESYNLFWTPPPPLVPRHLRLGVIERMSASGEVLKPIDDGSVRKALDTFREQEVDAIAICFMNAYSNPAHEDAAEAILLGAGYEGEISKSSSLSREYHDYERTSTTCIDAFVRARMADYLDRLEDGLGALGFQGQALITRSGGGAMMFGEARTRSYETINSGPVAGVEGAAALSRRAGLGDLVTADVGGTSFDATLVLDGQPTLLYQGDVIGMPLQAEWIDVRSIGSGGGSIAYIDEGGLLQVGPKSAGAVPGPACYGRGGTLPTTTDAAFLLGMLGAGSLASNLTLDRSAAEAAFAPLAATLGRSIRDVAIGVIEIAAASMANAVREITVEKGVDPRSLKLLAFGGAGPMLGTQIARELHMDHVVVPPYAGNFSAWGLLGADLTRTTSQTFHMALEEAALPTVAQQIGAMIRGLRESLSDEDRADTTESVSLSLRFKGQEHALTIPIAFSEGAIMESAAAIDERFRAAYAKSFAISLPNDAEIITVRCGTTKKLPKIEASSAAGPAVVDTPASGFTMHSFSKKMNVEAHLISRAAMTPGKAYAGPLVILEPTTTTYVDCNFVAHVDEHDCLHLKTEGLCDVE
jgi:N-methylhydantoinase A